MAPFLVAELEGEMLERRASKVKDLAEVAEVAEFLYSKTVLYEGDEPHSALCSWLVILFHVLWLFIMISLV